MSCDSRDYFDIFVTSWITCFVLKEIWNNLAILRVGIYFELVIFSNLKCNNFLIETGDHMNL